MKSIEIEAYELLVLFLLSAIRHTSDTRKNILCYWHIVSISAKNLIQSSLFSALLKGRATMPQQPLEYNPSFLAYTLHCTLCIYTFANIYANAQM